MHHYDVWLDLECSNGNAREVVCTLFAKREFPVRPMLGERIAFWSAKDAPVSFDAITVCGVQSHHYVSTEIDELAHHFHPDEGQPIGSTLLRCAPIAVATVEDARKVVQFLSKQHGFELDPYGPSGLEARP